MIALLKAWEFIKKWGAALLGIVLLILGAGWLWSRYRNKLGMIRDELTVTKARAKIDELRAVRTEVERHSTHKDEEIAAIDQQIAEQKRAIVEAHEHGLGLKPEEIEDAYRSLGF